MLLERIGSDIGQSTPLVCRDWANTQAADRFLSNDRGNEADILSGHFQSTRGRTAAADGLVLMLHDTTEFTYQRERPELIGTNGGTAGEQVYSYNNASPLYTFRAAYQNFPYEITRKNALEGRANIYVAPNGNGTDVVVNARYVLTSTSTVTSLHQIYLNPLQTETLPSESMSFDTGKPSTVPAQGAGDTPVTCRANGTLEQRILDVALRQ